MKLCLFGNCSRGEPWHGSHIFHSVRRAADSQCLTVFLHLLFSRHKSVLYRGKLQPLSLNTITSDPRSNAIHLAKNMHSVVKIFPRFS